VARLERITVKFLTEWLACAPVAGISTAPTEQTCFNASARAARVERLVWTTSSVQTLFAIFGIGAGIIYAALGIAALRRLPNATEIDKTAGWSLWWFLERSRYSPEGQRLCSYGAISAAVAVACWVSWAGLGN